MKRHKFGPTLGVIVFSFAVGLSHIARPAGLSAQSEASTRAIATVVRADAAWLAHTVVDSLMLATASAIERLDGPVPVSTPREAAGGMVLWVERVDPLRRETHVTRVTVAHVGH